MIRILLTVTFFMLLMYGCSKKHHPSGPVPTPEGAVKAGDSSNIKKAIKPKRKSDIPKVIVVNDNVARKSIDGRLYYDLLGQRYWKNYKDGKYYLFNKSMYSNDAFKPR